MEELTRTTTLLLNGLHDPSNRAAWQELCARCIPIIASYARRRGLQSADGDDVAQEVLSDFAVAYRAGQYDREKGRLRHWLAGFARRRISKFLTKQVQRHEAVGQYVNPSDIDQVADVDCSDAIWEEEWERHVVSLCTAQARHEFDEKQFRAFEQYAMAGRPVGDVATELGMTTNAVYIAKTRVLSRLRQLQNELCEVF